METQQQTNGDIIMFSGQKTMFDNSIVRTGSLNAPDVNSTDNNQFWKNAAVGFWPECMLTFQDLCLS